MTTEVRARSPLSNYSYKAARADKPREPGQTNDLAACKTLENMQAEISVGGGLQYTPDRWDVEL